jgi:predicted metal-dependent phosphoesterase TrpH
VTSAAGEPVAGRTAVPVAGRPDGATPAEPFVDLHTHTTASDGAATPTELVDRARAVGLAAVALTDHDTVAGVADARAAGARVGLAVIAGVELSAVDGDREVHVLGLHLDDTGALEPLLVELRDARRRRADAMVGALRGLGVGVTLDTVLAEAGAGAVGRPHVARALIAGGWVRDQREAFDRYLGSGRPAYVVKQRLPLSDAIQMLHAAGGIAVLAHPGRDGTRARLEAAQRVGLVGVEVRHPGHNAEDEARLRALADYLQLVPSGGSDWHGATEGTRVLGSMRVPAAWAERQAARAQAYRPAGNGTWSSATASHS